MVRHRLVGSEYADRRADCEAAAAALGVASLRDSNAASAALLAGDPGKRARHVVGEIARVDAAVAAMVRGDLAVLGALMNASHASLADDMEVSTRELDTLAGIARTVPGVHGARMMGGGFGGSVIALVDAARADAAQAEIVARYAASTGVAATAMTVRAVDGAHEVAT
jgi:galactokinase